jgi:hypothetical protein
VCPSLDIDNKIGRIVTNLQALEFVLRLFLDARLGHPGTTKDIPVELTKLSIGEWVPVNYFTNFDSLKQLIQKVNTELKESGLSEHIDESIVELRDAIAHGRVLSLHPNGTFTILKFSPPLNDKTQVTVSVKMTPDWLSEQIQRTYNEIIKIVRIGQSLGLDCFPKDNNY